LSPNLLTKQRFREKAFEWFKWSKMGRTDLDTASSKPKSADNCTNCFGHIIPGRAPQEGDYDHEQALVLIALGLALMVGAATTVEVMTLFPDSAAACVNGNC